MNILVPATAMHIWGSRDTGKVVASQAGGHVTGSLWGSRDTGKAAASQAGGHVSGSDAVLVAYHMCVEQHQWPLK